MIGPEDVLEILVWKNEELSRVCIVRPDGMITLPLVGDVKAAGRTPDDLQSEIVSRLGEYQQTVVASVIVQEIKSYKVYVLGEVEAPGVYPITSKTTVMQAIALAGGFTEYASKNKVTLIRANSTQGEEKKIRIRFSDIVDVDETDDNNLVLNPGDTIFVP